MYTVEFMLFVCFTLVIFRVNQVKAVLYLQIGDKCDESSGTPNVIPHYDEITNDNETVSETSSLICDPSVPLECLSGRCQCKKGYTINRNGTRCLEVARNGLDSTCEENIQCWKSLLGRMSECNVEIGKCQCYETETLPIVFHQGRCYYGESLGDYCQIEGLCEATTSNAACRSGSCQCLEGHIPSWDKSRCLPIATDGLNSTCEENIQCEKSQLGALSECNQQTMKCNCYKIPMVDTLFFGGKCYFEASLGDVCQVNAQCQSKTSNSICSRDGKCFCDDGYISNGNNTLCLPIPSSDGAASASGGGPGTDSTNINNNNNNSNGECLEDSQCFRVLGPFSRCNAVKQKCECFVPENLHLRRNSSTDLFKKGENEINEVEQLDLDVTSLVMVGSKCYLGKFLGQPCKFNKQCSAVTENSWCDNGRCECLDETHVRSEDRRKCLKIGLKGLSSACDEDAQCIKSELGPLSRCNLERKKCECSNNIMPVVFFKGKCHFHRQLGSSCESNVECQAGSNYLAECSMGRCRCQNGTMRLSPHVCGFPTVANFAGRIRPLFSTLLGGNMVLLILKYAWSSFSLVGVCLK
ncbi:unnamed protein product [Orchesella dallaii]|uniref:EB domain-containing protein n=1 Tax=Orchesella dallaii TaxID=48710 RepID=A0ABP1RXC1_9HEXA